MTPRPPTHREPNKAECRKMPPGSLYYDFEDDEWKYLEGVIGKEIETAKFFAVPITGQEVKQEPQKTLRDEFAMAALTGELASSSTAESAEATAKAAEKAGLEPAQYLAKLCYEIADAMLAARNQTA